MTLKELIIVVCLSAAVVLVAEILNYIRKHKPVDKEELNSLLNE